MFRHREQVQRTSIRQQANKNALFLFRTKSASLCIILNRKERDIPIKAMYCNGKVLFCEVMFCWVEYCSVSYCKVSVRQSSICLLNRVVVSLSVSFFATIT